MARVLFTTFGSYGDLYPYLAIGAAIQKLGHTAAIATSAAYRRKVEAEGIGFFPVRPDLALSDPELMRYFFDRRRGTERVVRALAEVLRESYEDTLAIAPEFDVIVTHPTSLAAVLVAEKLKMPWVSSVLAPGSFISAYDPPLPAPAPWLIKARLLGPGAMRVVWKLSLRMIDGWLQPVHDFRREIGLKPGGNPLLEGATSPDLVLALFSPIFAPTQPDWPRQTVVTGFPFHDERVGLAPELAAFFESGPPPIVFTLGSSAVLAAGDFYAVSLKAIERIGVRALFLTGPQQPQNMPSRLPDRVLLWQYAPHEQVFSRAAVVVHQGGVGTTAQALRSGRPMLIMPFAHDQYDNAERVRRLGAGVWMPRNKYREPAVASALSCLTLEPRYRESAEAAARSTRAESGALSAAQAIHRYVAQFSVSMA